MIKSVINKAKYYYIVCDITTKAGTIGKYNTYVSSNTSFNLGQFMYESLRILPTDTILSNIETYLISEYYYNKLLELKE